MNQAIEIKNLTKRFRTYRKKPGLKGAIQGLFHREYDETLAANDISFSVQPGEFVGFLGPNGAGKTTTLKMLSGLLHPSSGSATVLGFTPSRRENDFKKRFSLVMGQKNALWWDLAAADSLELSRVIYQIETAVYQKRLDELTELLDVKDKLNILVRELSLGERMKFELINALIHSPQVLLLDEPTIGLDVTSQKKVRDFLKTYNEIHKVTILLTSHYMQDIEELCSRVVLIDHGTVRYDGSLAGIVEKFSGTKVIQMNLHKPLVNPIPEHWGEVLESSGLLLKLKVPRDQISDVCREILAETTLSDITIEEVPIEEIMRQLFGEQKTADELTAKGS